MTRSPRHFHSPAAVLCGIVAMLLAGAVPAAAKGPVLQKKRAREVAVKTAQKVRRDLRSEGARGAGVAGCWRNSARRVSCYLKVTGYDSELDLRWTCMLRMIVEVRLRADGVRLKSRVLPRRATGWPRAGACGYAGRAGPDSSAG